MSATVLRTKMLVVIAFVALFASAHASLRTKPARIKDTPGGLQEVLDAGPPSESQQLTNLMDNVQKFKAFALGSRMGVEERHAAEQARLQDSIGQTETTFVQNALSASVSANSMSLLETRRIYDGMIDFADSLSDVLAAAQSKGSACEQMVCGAHASCTDTVSGAQCVCNEGFVGNGATGCEAPPQYYPHSILIQAEDLATRTNAFDLHISAFSSNKVVIAFRDASKGNIGRFCIGFVREAGMVDMSPPVQFTNSTSQAWDPQVVGTSDERLVFAWRDSPTAGTGKIKGGALGLSGVRGAENAVTWGNEMTVCAGQDHAMILAVLPLNRVALFYSDHTLATQHTPSDRFGIASLLQVDQLGTISIIGTQRFADVPVCRLKVTKVSPSSFVLAARAGPSEDEMADETSQQEALAVYGYMLNDVLVFEKAANFEPQQSTWARDLSLIAPNTVAYAYQTTNPLQIKMAVMEIDPATHIVNVTQQPVVVREGFTPYIGMISVPYAPNSPHTLMYYEDQNTGRGQVQLCTWSSAMHALSDCEDFEWAKQQVTSVDGVHMGGGKSLMVFAPPGGTPFYTMFGVAMK